MHNYQGKHGRLPPAVVYGEDGTPLHSWRVLILPFIEQEPLFRRFKLDEPWDSPHNIQLLPEMPRVFAPYDGSTASKPHTTFYQVFVGKGAAFEGSNGLRLDKDFPDGTSSTFLIVEAGEAVPWTKPADLPYDAGQPLPRLGGLFKDTFRVAFADASVQSFKQSLSEPSLRAGITRNGGDQPGRDWRP
jgi:hypothetical protein